MTRTIAALLAAVAIASVAAPASAQAKYFARERIVGVSASSNGGYDGTWNRSEGPSYCSGTTRLRDVTVTCSGASCDPSIKPSSTPVQAGTCSVSCSPTFTAGKFASAVNGAMASGAASNETQALNFCRNINRAGACGYYAGNGSAYFWYGQTKLDDQPVSFKALLCTSQ